jgi:hypothetical protein
VQRWVKEIRKVTAARTQPRLDPAKPPRPANP